MSGWDVGIGHSLGWAEAFDLFEAAIADPSTQLFAAVAAWDWPATMPELISIVGTYGNEATHVLPFDSAGGSGVSDAEVEAVVAELLEEIRFNN